MSMTSINKTLIALGEGDILTGMVVDRGVGTFVFMRAPDTKAPGTPAPEFDDKFGIEDADVAIMFGSLASIDQHVEALMLLRTKMKTAGMK